MYTSLVPAAISVWRACVFMWEKEILHRLTRSLSRSHTHPHCCHTPIAAVNQSPWQLCLRRWHNGGTGVTSCPAWWVVSVCVCVCVCAHVCAEGLVFPPFCRIKHLLPFSSPALLCMCVFTFNFTFNLSIHSCFLLSLLSLPLLSLPVSQGRCGVERCRVLFSCCCQLSPRPLQDKAVIAPGTAGLSSSSSKQICGNFICNWALNWKQIEAALCSSGKGEGSELGVVGKGGEMIPGSFMSGKVGLLSGRGPRQGSYF